MAKNVQKDCDKLDVELNVKKSFNIELEEKVQALEEEQKKLTKAIE